MIDFDGLSDLIWVTKGKNSIDVSIYLYVDPDAKKIYAITRQPDSSYVAELGLAECRIDSRWSIPNRAEMESYKRDSAAYNPQTETLTVSEFTLSDCVISHHLEALLLDGTEVALERDSERVLDPSSLVQLKSLHTGIYDTLYAKYCDEACIPT